MGQQQESDSISSLDTTNNNNTSNMQEEVVVVNTGTGNIATMLAFLRSANLNPVLSDDPGCIHSARRVVYPGVGSFGEAMKKLKEKEVEGVLKERMKAGLPTLSVCIGIQTMACSSDESPGVKGMGVLEGMHISALPKHKGKVMVPQQGWNYISASHSARLAVSGHVYFSNSYAMTAAPLGWDVSTSCHGVPFVASVEKGAVLGCQFHPELSGETGRLILQNWLKTTPEGRLKRQPLNHNVSQAWKHKQNESGNSNSSSSSSSSSSLVSPPPLTTVTKRIIPCLDVKGGRVVKGVSFEGLRDAGDPVELAMEYQRQGADELTVLDISATQEERATAEEIIKAIRSKSLLPMCVGGGVNSVDAARRLLGAGADKVAVNTGAVRNPGLIGEIASCFGSQCMVLAVDARRRREGEGEEGKVGGWEVVVKSGKERTGLDVVEWVKKGVELGAGEILLTSFDSDGRGEGFDCELLREVSQAVDVPVIASGGGKDPQHMLDALASGADAVLAATIFHFGHTTVGKLKRDMLSLLKKQQQRESDATTASCPFSSSSLRLRPPPTPLQQYAALLRNCPKLSPKGQTTIPSIDLMKGNSVQLEGGNPDALKVDAGDPLKLINKFGIAGDVAIIDLDAALGKGSNAATIKNLISSGISCRVGGGIRTVEKATEWLEAGAKKVIIGTAASIEFCSKLPRDRTMVALDAYKGEVVTHGWKNKTGFTVEAKLRELAPVAGAFLITSVEREGRMVGVDIPFIASIVRLATELSTTDKPIDITVAGGVALADDITALDVLGVQVQIGMALYTNALHLGDAIAAPLVSDRADYLVPTTVVDESKHVLGLAYSSPASIRVALDRGMGVYWSRSRGLWIKGETSGATQKLLNISLDCDRDALCFTVRQEGASQKGFCHLPTQSTCFGQVNSLVRLREVIQDRLDNAPPSSYSSRLLNDPALLKAKLVEEAAELADASPSDPDHVAFEFADLMYFAHVAAVRAGISMADVEFSLDQKALKVKRRKGDAKPQILKAIERGIPGAELIDPVSASSSTSPSSSSSSTPSPSSSSPSSLGPRDSGVQSRATSETTISARVNLDGKGEASVSSGFGFLDHMITTLAKHSSFDLSLSVKGDTHIDDHHSIEDAALVLGQCFASAIEGGKGKAGKGIARWGYSLCPLDDSLARAVVDVSGRPFAQVDLKLKREMIGSVSTEMLDHFVRSFAGAARVTLHLSVLEGANDHHKAEAAFKALAVALKMAVAQEGGGVPSTKGMLDF